MHESHFETQACREKAPACRVPCECRASPCHDVLTNAPLKSKAACAHASAEGSCIRSPSRPVPAHGPGGDNVVAVLEKVERTARSTLRRIEEADEVLTTAMMRG